jgi:hypothetical protein
MRPGEQSSVKVHRLYGVDHARTVVRAAIEDYAEAYPGRAG